MGKIIKSILLGLLVKAFHWNNVYWIKYIIKNWFLILGRTLLKDLLSHVLLK